MRLPPSGGSEDCLAAILREVWPEFGAYVRRMLRCEPHLIEDVMNEAAADLIQYWRRKGELDRDRAVAVLKQAARCDVLNHWAKQGRRRTSTVAIDDKLLLDHADPDSDKEILAALGRIDYERLVQQLPTLLTERQRQVIVAVDIECLPQARAARQLGMSLRGLQNLRKTALDRLRQHLTAPPSASGPSREVPR